MNDKERVMDELLASPQPNNLVTNMNDKLKAAIERAAKKRRWTMVLLVRVVLAQWLIDNDPSSIE